LCWIFSLFLHHGEKQIFSEYKYTGSFEANFVTQTKRTGRTDEYRVTPASDWVPKEELDEIRKAIAGKSPKTSVDEETEID
jgi:hypothetical protein